MVCGECEVCVTCGEEGEVSDVGGGGEESVLERRKRNAEREVGRGGSGRGEIDLQGVI